MSKNKCKQKFKNIARVLMGGILLGNMMLIKSALPLAQEADINVTQSRIRLYGAMFFIMAILFIHIAANIRINNKLKMQNEKYELLAHISNEYLYDYRSKDDHFELSDKCIELFGSGDNFDNVKDRLKQELFTNGLKEPIQEISLPLVSGEMGVFKVVSANVFDSKGAVHAVIGKLINISKETAEKQQLMIQAQVDGLTNLNNPITTQKLINQSIKHKPKHKTDALIVIDFDDFKDINDTFGHLEGNETLKTLSNTLRLIFRENDIIGRIGGDEFCVYMKNIHSVDVVKMKCNQINNLIRKENGHANTSVSCGIAVLTDEQTYEALFDKADQALYEAKKRGGAQAYVYSK